MIRSLPWWKAALALALALLLLAVPMLTTSSSQLSLANHILITIVFAMSFNLLFGFTGLLSFGHAVYFGLPAFATIALMNHIAGSALAVPAPLLPLFGFALGGILGFLLGYVATRNSGAVFAMITLGIGEMVVAATYIFSDIFGGEEGLAADRAELPSFIGLEFVRSESIYYLLLFWTVLSVAAMLVYLRSAQGQIGQAVRDNEQRAASLGYDPKRVRHIAFTVSAAFAGIAGSLYALNNELVTSGNVGLTESGHIIFVVYIGGAGHPFGPLLGALVLQILEWLLRNGSEAWPIYTGVFFVAMVLFAPGGLASAIKAHAALPLSRLRHLLPAYAVFLAALVLFLFGLGLLVELAYALSFGTPYDPPFSYFGIGFDTSAAIGWIAGALVASLGVAGLAWAGPRARRAFDDVAGAAA